MTTGGLPSTIPELDNWLSKGPECGEVAGLLEHLPSNKLCGHLLRETPVGGKALAERVVTSYPEWGY